MRVNPILVAALCAASIVPALAAPTVVNDVNNAMSKNAMTINLTAQNGSKQDGQAFIHDTSGGLWVKVQLKNVPKGASEPAHIHLGTCAKLNPAPWKPLTNVVNGLSVTTIPGLTTAQIKKGKYAINVHQSATNISHYVSCGDL